MPRISEDRVLETSTTTGTGDFTLAGAVTGFRAFSAVMTSPSDTCYYGIEAVDGSGVPTGEWETGLGTYSAANTLTRTTVLESSNGGAAVNFSAGTKRVFIAALANAALGFDATQGAPDFVGNGQTGRIPKVVVCDVGTETLSNSTTSDQDFTSVYTIPANSLFAKKSYRVTFLLETVTGVSSVTTIFYVKLGSTKVLTLSATNMGDSSTRSSTVDLTIFGREAPGAAANVSCAATGIKIGDGLNNTTNQPVALATNGSLAITPGVTFSGTGSTESVELQAWSVEELN